MRLGKSHLAVLKAANEVLNNDMPIKPVESLNTKQRRNLAAKLARWAFKINGSARILDTEEGSKRRRRPVHPAMPLEPMRWN